jgi:ornithine cyclodeaminase
MHLTAEQVHALLDYPPLVEALRDLFRRGVDEAKSIHRSEKLPDGRENIWLLLPAWQHGRHQGVKLVSVFPGNEAKGLLSVVGVYVLFDGTNGYPLAVIDGAALTLRKTAANSALAATYLARKDAGKLLMLGGAARAPSRHGPLRRQADPRSESGTAMPPRRNRWRQHCNCRAYGWRLRMIWKAPCAGPM